MAIDQEKAKAREKRNNEYKKNNYTSFTITYKKDDPVVEILNNLKQNKDFKLKEYIGNLILQDNQ